MSSLSASREVESTRPKEPIAPSSRMREARSRPLSKKASTAAAAWGDMGEM